MNALANGGAYALAHGDACAMSRWSVHAKTREGKGPHQKGPHHTTPETIAGYRMHSSSPYVGRDEPVDNSGEAAHHSAAEVGR